ncbi:MAG: tRNA (guanine-N1)-methyltransferase [Cyanobacteria bacterium P01_A01_bin.135]
MSVNAASSPPNTSPVVTEGAARFRTEGTFYRATSALSRDLGVLAALDYRQRQGELSVLDAMSGCGVRSLRYWLESGADEIWANDSNPEVGPTLRHNLREAIAKGNCRITHRDANEVFFDCYQQRRYYDLVDVDAFGAPGSWLGSSLWATKIGGLLYLTHTDGSSSCGRYPIKSLAAFGAYARHHPAKHEQALRLMIGRAVQEAANKQLGVTPLLSLRWGSVYRTLLRLEPSCTLSEANYGFLGYCHACGNYQTVSWRHLGHGTCSCADHPLCLSGPLWLGPLHQPSALARWQQQASQWGWDAVAKLLQVMVAEANLPPYFLRLQDIGKRGQLNLPPRSQLVAALQGAGYRASATHIDAAAIKTDADLQTCIEVARSLGTDE